MESRLAAMVATALCAIHRSRAPRVLLLSPASLAGAPAARQWRRKGAPKVLGRELGEQCSKFAGTQAAFQQHRRRSKKYGERTAHPSYGNAVFAAAARRRQRRSRLSSPTAAARAPAVAPHHSDGGVAVALVAARAAQRRPRTEGLPLERRAQAARQTAQTRPRAGVKQCIQDLVVKLNVVVVWLSRFSWVASRVWWSGISNGGAWRWRRRLRWRRHGQLGWLQGRRRKPASEPLKRFVWSRSEPCRQRIILQTQNSFINGVW
jgi:hypothetical protein